MLYHFDLARSVAQNIVVIREGDFPLFDLRIRVMDMDTGRDVFARVSRASRPRVVELVLADSSRARCLLRDGLSNKALNEDGRLITADYVLPKPRT